MLRIAKWSDLARQKSAYSRFISIWNHWWHMQLYNLVLSSKVRILVYYGGHEKWQITYLYFRFLCFFLIYYGVNKWLPFWTRHFQINFHRKSCFLKITGIYSRDSSLKNSVGSSYGLSLNKRDKLLFKNILTYSKTPYLVSSAEWFRMPNPYENRHKSHVHVDVEIQLISQAIVMFTMIYPIPLYCQIYLHDKWNDVWEPWEYN